MKYPLTEDALNKIGKAYVRILRANIRKKQFPYGHPQRGTGNKIASGELYDSISYKIVQFEGEPAIQLTYSDHFEYVNQGRRIGAKRVPLKVLIDWINIRGLKPQPTGKRGRPNIKKLAWAIQTNIFKYGIRPAGLYDLTLEGVEDWLDPNTSKSKIPPELLEELNNFYIAIQEDMNVIVEKIIVETL